MLLILIFILINIPIVFIFILGLSLSFSLSFSSSLGLSLGIGEEMRTGARQNAGIVFVEECSVASAAEFGNAGLADGEKG